MHNIFMRLLVLVSYCMTVSAAVTILIILSKSYQNPTVDEPPIVQVKIRSFQLIRDRQGMYDVAVFYLNTTADLSNFFNWNVKQLFVYLMVEYHVENDLRKAIIWDAIIERGQDPKFHFSNMYSRYMLYDEKNNLRGKTVNTSLHWNVIRTVGPLCDHSVEGDSFQFPLEYDKVND